MNLHEEHALLKVLNKLYPETKDMTTAEIIVHLNTLVFIGNSIKQEKGINEAFKTAITEFASSGV